MVGPTRSRLDHLELGEAGALQRRLHLLRRLLETGALFPARLLQADQHLARSAASVLLHHLVAREARHRIAHLVA